MIFEKQVVQTFKDKMYTRCDDTGRAFYFSSDDFEGLHRESYPFTATAGHTLQGYLYHYDNPIADRLIIFDHGFGGGHRSYMREIEMLCRHGFRVFAYDHTGCMESGGASPNGLAQSLADLDDCLRTIKGDARFTGLTLSVMGHSWGGFSTLNIAALHPEIKHVVVLSGFVSVEVMVGCFFGGLLKGYRKAVMALERQSNPNYVNFSAVDSLSKTDAKVLLIYSADDPLCRKDPHYDMLRAGLSQRENIRFLLVEGKGHNPNYTKDAVQYLAEYGKAVKKAIKQKQLETDAQKAAFRDSFDWKRMTEQDDTVWQEIFRTLDA